MATMMKNVRTRPWSVVRGEIATRGLYVFEHDSELRNAHAHSLFDRLTAKRREGVEVPRDFGAYCVTFDGNEVEVGQAIKATPGVTLIRRC